MPSDGRIHPDGTASPALPVYLVHWYAPEWCVSAARSVLASHGVDVALTVIDNGASGGPALRDALPDAVDVVSVEGNAGYAGAANIALEHWRAHHPDSSFCVIGSHDLHVEPDTLEKLLDVITAEHDVGIAGPAILAPKAFVGGSWNGRKSSLVTRAPSTRIVDRDWASGTCLALRRECVAEIGGFDETFGSYAEDVDIGLRARDHGWRVVVVCDAHARGLGTKSPRAESMSAANAILLNLKRRGAIGGIESWLQTLLRTARGMVAGVNPCRSRAQRRQSRRSAAARVAALLDVTTSRRTLAAYRNGRGRPRTPARPTTPRCEERGLHVVFISHEAHRTGAPILLLRMVRWLKSNTDIRCTVLCAQHGPLVEELSAVAEVVVLPGRTPLLGAAVARLGQPPARDPIRRIRTHLACRRFASADVLYVNSLANGVAVSLVQLPGVPMVCHVHELGGAIRARLTDREWAAIDARTVRYVAVSEAVRTNLVEDRGVDPGRVTVIRGFVEPTPESGADPDLARRTARMTLGLPADAVVVGGAGRADWTKGADLFVAVAASAARTAPDLDLRFAWIGATKAAERVRLDQDLQSAGIVESVVFTGVRDDAPACFAAFDLLALTSREDSFPLVVLECALMGVPTVSFAGAGGSTEFTRDDCGISVPYLDVHAFARAVVELGRDRARRHQLGARAAERVVAGYSADAIMPELVDVITRVSGRAPISPDPPPRPPL